MSITIKNEIKLEVRYIDETKGFGVFACEFIPKDTIVEICYSIKLFRETTHPAYDYLFSCDSTKSYLPFGYGSIYNHSNEPNIDWRVISEEHNLLKFFSIKDIDIDEELCHNYGERYWKARQKKLI